MKRLAILGLSLSASVLLFAQAGCAQEPPIGGAQGPALLNAEAWELKRLVVDGKEVRVSAESPATISWTTDHCQGSSGCNRFSGAARLAGASEVEMGPLQATQRACLDEVVMEQETAFFSLLSKATRYEMVKGRLVLTDGINNHRAEFVEHRPYRASLDKTRWVLTHLTVVDDGVAAAEVINWPTPIHLTIEGDRVTGYFGLSELVGEVSNDGKSEIRFHSLAAKESDAESELGERQARILQILERVDQFKISGSALMLIDSDSGAGMQWLEEKPAPEPEAEKE